MAYLVCQAGMTFSPVCCKSLTGNTIGMTDKLACPALLHHTATATCGGSIVCELTGPFRVRL